MSSTHKLNLSSMTMHRKHIKPIKHMELAIAPTLHHSDCAAQMCDTLCACYHPHMASARQCCQYAWWLSLCDAKACMTICESPGTVGNRVQDLNQNRQAVQVHLIAEPCAGMIQDDGHIPNTVEKQIFETLVKIRQRDHSIYDSNKHFFAESADADASAAKQGKKASKPMMLKDVIAQQVHIMDTHLLATLLPQSATPCACHNSHVSWSCCQTLPLSYLHGKLC